MTEFVTMRDIGAAVGLTSHQIGKLLKKLGLRTPNGKPTRSAFDQGLCAQRWARDGRGYCWAWDVQRVLPLLGVPAKKPDPATHQLPTGTDKTDQPADGPKP
jgi:hypothetical protein